MSQPILWLEPLSGDSAVGSDQAIVGYQSGGLTGAAWFFAGGTLAVGTTATLVLDTANGDVYAWGPPFVRRRSYVRQLQGPKTSLRVGYDTIRVYPPDI